MNNVIENIELHFSKNCVKSLRELLSQAVEELEWWENEHSCCKGKSDEFLSKVELLLELTK